MRPIITLHGVGLEPGDYSRPMRREIERLCKQQGQSMPSVTSIDWSHRLNEPGDHSPGEGIDSALDVIRYERKKKQVVDGVFFELAALARSFDQLPVVVAHSLGSVLAVDIALALAECKGHAPPWAHLVTFGSPLGTDVPLLDGIAYRDRIAPARSLLADKTSWGESSVWADFWNKGDFVATGALYGVQIAQGSHGLIRAGYPVDVSIEVELGNDPLRGHTGYWGNTHICENILQLCGF